MSAISVLDRDNVPLGPFTPEQVRENLRTGDFTLDDLAYMEGLEAWTPLRQVLSLTSGQTRPQLAPSASFQAHADSVKDLPYAGFWMRYIAHLLDAVILLIPTMMVALGSLLLSRFYDPSMPVLYPASEFRPINVQASSNAVDLSIQLYWLIFLGTVAWLYFALQECSAAQATIGKRVMSLKVTDLRGERIGFIRASVRYFGKIISTLILYFGYIMAGLTTRRQALHDIIARTVVVRE